MPRPPASKPMFVPYGADETLYLVVDRIRRPGGVCRETEFERAEFETVLADLISGKFNDPVRVVAFNTLDHWAKDVSKDIAAEIQTLCDIEGAEVPEHIRDFVASHVGPVRQFAMPLA